MESFFKKKSTDFCESCATFSMQESCILCSNDQTPFEMASIKYSSEKINYSDDLGFYTDLFSGYSEKYKKKSTAGGLATLILEELLNKIEVDAVIAPVYSIKENMFKYELIKDASLLTSQQRSVYTKLDVSRALKLVESFDGTVAITGIPATVQYIEALKQRDTLYRDKIKFTIGLVSGGYKTNLYETYLSEKAGAPDERIWDYVSFRDKKLNYPYNGQNYFFVKKRMGNEYSCRSGDIKYNWQYGVLKEFSSDFCSDTFNVVADVTVMDAWLPKFETSDGRTLVVSRSTKISNILQNSNDANIEEISSDEIIASQMGGLRHKTRGLSARISLYKKFGNDLPARLLKLPIIHKKIDLLEQFLRLYVSYLSRVKYRKYGDALRLENSMKRYSFPLKVVNRIKHYLD
ncbi:MAG: Uncharacterised protein [Formosa sp. Hel3_A1_48]|nr:MAG: Uncharacterised protein [Formosa sp. Hel3_A1_48]